MVIDVITELNHFVFVAISR